MNSPAFVPDLKADAAGTSLVATTPMYTFAQVLAVLGDPLPEADGYKVSTEWIVVEAETGLVVTLYDYKMTSLYDESYPSVGAFRALPYEWHVGAHDDGSALRFVTWLAERVAPLLPPAQPEVSTKGLFTPRVRGVRVRMQLSPQDSAKIGRGGPWSALVTDLNTGKRWRARGASCGSPRCFCDAIAVAVKS